MRKEDNIPSQVIPILIAIIVCDVIVEDPASGKKNLIGVFDTIHVRKFPTKRPMSIYIKLADAQGDYTIEIRYIQTNSGEILAKAEGRLEAPNKPTTVDMFTNFRVLPIPAPGPYEFQVWTNGIFLGQTIINTMTMAE